MSQLDPMGKTTADIQVQHDRDDYEQFLRECGLTKELVDKWAQNRADQSPTPVDYDSIELRPSMIEGLGMFCRRAIAEGELIASVRIGDNRTHAGRYINHSVRPNSRFEASPTGDLAAYALVAIPVGEEVTVDYRQAMQAARASAELISKGQRE